MKLKIHEIKNILISNIRRNDIIYDMIWNSFNHISSGYDTRYDMTLDVVKLFG